MTITDAAKKYLRLSQEWMAQSRRRNNDRGYDELLGKTADAAQELQKAIDEEGEKG